MSADVLSTELDLERMLDADILLDNIQVERGPQLQGYRQHHEQFFIRRIGVLLDLAITAVFENCGFRLTENEAELTAVKNG